MPRAAKGSQVAHELSERDIREGRFTPFIGAGASSLWSGELDLESYPWNEVAMTLTAITSRLGDRSRNFLRSFAKDRLSLSPSNAIRIVPPTNQGLPPISRPELCNSLLVKLQAELVRAAVSLTNYFGIRLSQENPSVNFTENCGVDFDLTSEDVVGALARDCLPRLLSIADLVLQLKGSKREQRESPFLLHLSSHNRRLRLEELYDKLTLIIKDLTGSSHRIISDENGSHALGSRQLASGEASSPGKLRLDAIQWLVDSLWYTVRYWVPCYPTTAELAYELSLATSDGPPRRAELAQTAQALENIESGLSARIVGDLVAYCEKVRERKWVPDRQIEAFYYAIAAALQYQFEKYQAHAPTRKSNLNDRFRGRGRVSDVPQIQRMPVPLAFTTNFDRALEKVFEESGICYHLVFPVVGKSHPGDEKAAASPVWKMWTRQPKNATTSKPVNWLKVCNNEGVPCIAFEGPLIVKLHGSPSLPLEDTAIQHWIVLSELSYLQALIHRAPLWLEQQLEGCFHRDLRRSLLFLGYSISDWNVRLRLYGDSLEHFGVESARRSTLSNIEDCYRFALLDNLGVDRHFGNLNDFPGVVLRLLQDRDIEKGGALTQLLEKLAELY